MNILITYGGTSEKIDNVRYITNFSSGNTGFLLAEELNKQHSVTCIAAKKAPQFNQNTYSFISFEDLDTQAKQVLSSHDFDVVIHCAAVSDYLVEEVKSLDNKSLNRKGHKIQSGQRLQIILKPSYKIIERLKTYSKNPNIKVIGFKLTDTNSDIEILDSVKSVINSGADYVVHNDLKNITDEQHSGHVFASNLEVIADFTNKLNLAQTLNHLISENL